MTLGGAFRRALVLIWINANAASVKDKIRMPEER
jgi:hypothetical protein